MDNFTENVSKHFGLPWTNLIEHCRKAIKDKPPDQVVKSQRQVPGDVTSRLQKEDACTFGLRPALDECLLTMCDQCGAVIKPQALYSHIEKRHKNNNGEASVQHLLTEKPIVKGLSLKAKNKNSPRNSPKLTSNCDTNLLDKYKLPKPPVNRIGGKFAPGSLEQSNSALAKQLRSGAQPIVALDDVGLAASIANPSSIAGQSESHNDLALTPKSSLASNSRVVQSTSSASKQLPSKRSLDSILSTITKSEPPKKLKLEPNSDVSVKEEVNSVAAHIPAISTPSPQNSSPTEEYSPKPIFSFASEDTVVDKDPLPTKSSPKLYQITTIDKSIPCKDREYDPNRHCGCWLDEWGKHCTRSLTCKSHALSLRRKVPGRSKPFDTLLLEHREAKEALLQNKLKLPKKKPSASSSAVINAKLQKQRSTPTVVSLFGETEADAGESSARTQTDFLGYSAFHPRPLAVACHGARLCGPSYVANRQLDSLRITLRQALEKPRQPKKLCSTKNVKSVNGGAPKGSQFSHGALSANSLALLQSAHSAAKVKSLSDKKKKAKRSASADTTKSLHPPFSHRMASPPSVPVSPSQGLALTDSLSTNLPLKSASSGSSSSTINLLTNGATTQLIRANLLNDVWSTNRQQKGNPADVNKTKLASRNSIQLPVNASNIATLSNKQLTLLDGLPCTFYSAPSAATSNDSSRQSVVLGSQDILSRAANGIVMQSSTADRKLDNQQSAVLELLPKYTSAQATSQLNANSIQYVKSEGSVDATDCNFIQARNPNEKVVQQFTIANGSSLSSLNSVRAMQLKQQNKASSTVTIPIGSQPSLGQQQTLHHGGPTTATAHHGYG